MVEVVEVVWRRGRKNRWRRRRRPLLGEGFLDVRHHIRRRHGRLRRVHGFRLLKTKCNALVALLPKVAVPRWIQGIAVKGKIQIP